jgi:hypothetical protein
MCPRPRLSNPLQRHLPQPRQHLPSLASLPLPWLLLGPTKRAKALNQSNFAALLVLRITRFSASTYSQLQAMLSGQAQMCPTPASRETSVNEQIRSLDGGLHRSSGRCHFSPVGWCRFLRLHLENRKPATNPENTLLDLRYLQSNERIKVPACDVNHPMTHAGRCSLCFSRQGKHSLGLPL